MAEPLSGLRIRIIRAIDEQSMAFSTNLQPCGGDPLPTPDMTLTEIAEHLFKVPGERFVPSVVWRFFDRRSISAVIPVALSAPVAEFSSWRELRWRPARKSTLVDLAHLHK